MSIRPYFVVAHALGQLSRRYLKVGTDVDFGLRLCESDQDALGAWRPADWEQLIEHECGPSPSLLSWMGEYLTRYNSSSKGLAQLIWRHLQWCQDNEVNYILLCDRSYPPFLRQIANPPLALSVIGDPKLLLSRPCVSVVGSRRVSRQLLHESLELGTLLADSGYSVISGGAYGCDIAVHKGVLKVKDSPFFGAIVFANGLASRYPQGNRHIFQDICGKGGLLLSERLSDQMPRPYDFTVRNRIISGLSMYTVVMGGAVRSGALSTARTAVNQGRDVLAYVPRRRSIDSEGCEYLVNDGALFFRDPQELLEILNSQLPQEELVYN